jgi:hypothetical protein
MIVLLVTSAMLVKTVTGTHVGPIHLYETFAQVQQTLGAAPIEKAQCDTGVVISCTPTMTYTDGVDTLVIRSEPLTPYPSKVTPASHNVERIEITRGYSAGGARIPDSVAALRSWTWETYGVFAPPPQSVAGWLRRPGVNGGGIFFSKVVCDLTEGDNPPGQVTFEVRRAKNASDQWEFDLSYIEFGERCQ